MEWASFPLGKAEQGMKPVINARVESIQEGKPYSRGAFRSARCAVIARWILRVKKLGREVPLSHHDAGPAPFCDVGCLESLQRRRWIGAATCAIITTLPNELMKESMTACRQSSSFGYPSLLDPKARENDLFSLLSHIRPTR